MKAFLMYPDRNFEWQSELPLQSKDLVADLGVNVLFNAMAAGDEFLFGVVQRAVLRSLTDPATIVYRQAAWTDCLEHPDVVRALYGLAVETLKEKREIWGFLSNYSSDLNLSHAVQVMQLMVKKLKRLREIAVESGQRFRSPAFKRFFAMLLEELDDPYFELVNGHLDRLKFPRGVLVSARLGRGNAGVDFVLRRPLEEKQRWADIVPELVAVLGPRGGRLAFEVHPRDEAGHQALEELRSRGINFVADALSQSADHVTSFFVQLRAELAFYIASLNLHSTLLRKGYATCLPVPLEASHTTLSSRGLYDVSLALTLEGRAVDNDVNADGKRLVVVTGANQGGKSTFLRSAGLAQLMMQAGMFVGAREFRANVATGVFTHFKREEDATMISGKLDEELRRMSGIVDHIQPGAILFANESFASTNEREGSDIGEEVLGALNSAGVKVLLVTHLYDLAERLRRDHVDGVHFLRAERLPDSTRTFKVRPGEALATSFGKDLYDEIFGADGSPGRSDP
jgi:hypothetical protein